jgi:hypothetical protein
MSTTPTAAGATAPADPQPRTFLVVHGNWYALDENGELLSGPILVSGQPNFADYSLVQYEASGDKRVEIALREIQRTLRWLRVTGIETDLAA